MGKRKTGRRKRRHRGGSLGTVLSTAAKIGYKLGKSDQYKRMGRSGVKTTYKRPQSGIDWKAFNRWRYKRETPKRKGYGAGGRYHYAY